jgi:hypothetical protein
MAEIVRRWIGGTVWVAGALAVGAAGATAQGGPGYLFGEPNVTVKVESGYAFQRAESELFDDAIERFTIDRRDFDSPYFGGDVAVRLTERWDLGVALGFQKTTIDSESRPYVGTDDLPILQTTELRQVPIVVSARYYPLERGRSLGRFAWIPRTFAPFLGVGVGAVSYRFEQSGEFVDEQTLDIYFDRFVSDRTGFLTRAAAGMNVSLGKQFLFTMEGRYSFGSAPVSGSYEGYDRVRLDGLQLIGGLGIRF